MARKAKAADPAVEPEQAQPVAAGEDTPTPEQAVQAQAVQVAQDPGHPEFVQYEIAKRIAHTLAGSALVPEAYRGRPADCFVAIQMGREVGMEPFQAIQSIAVIDGKPCLYGDGMIGVVKASPLCLYVKEWFDDASATAWCETLRKGDPGPTRRSFSLAEADTAGLSVKGVWRKYQKRMLQMRARGWCLRDAYPDVLKGLRMAEEVMDYNDEPAPIREFKLPEPKQAELPAPAQVAAEAVAQDTDALVGVIAAISSSASLAELLKAGDKAKKLTDPGDIAKARIAFREKRATLIPASTPTQTAAATAAPQETP